MLNRLYGMINSGSVIGEFISVIPVVITVGLIYAVCRYLKVKKNSSAVRWGGEVMKLLFVLYLTGLAALTLAPQNLWTAMWARVVVGYSEWTPHFFSGDFNLVPTFFGLISGSLTAGEWVSAMMLFNFLMFVPFGFFLPFVSDRVNIRNIFPVALAVPAVIEIFQPVIGRSFDIDDLILNFAGIICGYLVAALITGIMKRKKAESAEA